jgi:protein SCO1/2
MRLHKRGSIVALSAAIALSLGLAACSHPAPKIEAGSYPAANHAQCLPDITLIDQHGHDVALSSLKGHLVLIDFFYTRCPGPCPLMTARLVRVAKQLGPLLGKKITLVSVTIDPWHDRPPQLLKYATDVGANRDGWLFLTGTPAQIKQVMAIYHLHSHRDKNGVIEHSVAFFLLGPGGYQLRQYAPLEVKPAIVVADIHRVLAHG